MVHDCNRKSSSSSSRLACLPHVFLRFAASTANIVAVTFFLAMLDDVCSCHGFRVPTRECTLDFGKSCFLFF